MSKKSFLKSVIIGFCLLFLSLLITGLFGISPMMNGGDGVIHLHNYTYGLKASLGYYFQLFNPKQVGHETAFYGLVIMYVAILGTLMNLFLSIRKKQFRCIIPSLLLGAAVAYLPFILILVVPMVQLAVIEPIALLGMGLVTCLDLFAIFFLAFSIKDLLADAVSALKKFGGEEEGDYGQFKEKQAGEPSEEGLSEEEVRAIVEKYLQEHVEEKHAAPVVAAEPAPQPEPEPEPQPEPEPEPEPEAEPEEEEAEDEEEGDEEEGEAADDNSPVGLNIKGKRRRASFETRLKNSEFDIRHKYYDLRDYIKWYGLRNRISIPGDTFSYKRQRYVFVTIVGKHIRVYIGLNPDDYSDSTIPVEKAEAKKYEDLPCLLRVKSDLSYRRAKKLVDDLMQKIGIPQPDEDAPKETQE